MIYPRAISLRNYVVLMILCIGTLFAFTPGCEMSSSQRYEAASTTYNSAVATMTAMSLSGEISLEDIEKFDVVRKEAQDLLNEWDAALERGEEFDGMTQFNAILIRLVKIKLELEKIDDGGHTGSRGSPESERGYHILDPPSHSRAA